MGFGTLYILYTYADYLQLYKYISIDTYLGVIN